LITAVSVWISIRENKKNIKKFYFIALILIGLPDLTLLFIVTQLVLEMPRWFEPNIVLPITGMIIMNSINTVSLAAERFESELRRGENYISTRKTALDACLMP
jgi:putative ABC transport system permease protein